MSTPARAGQGGGGDDAAALADLRQQVEAAGVGVPGSPRAPRPLPLGPGGAVLGGEVPLVAVATTGRTQEEAVRQALAAAEQGADLVELRADLLDGTGHLAATPAALARTWVTTALAVTDALDAVQVPVLLTVRTAAEGGAADLDDAAYAEALTQALGLLRRARAQGRGQLVVALDVELVRGCLARLARAAHEAGTAVVGSAHFFTPLTGPDQEERLGTLLHRMQDEEADVAKVAVMPHDDERGRDDVLTLLRATARARAALDVPVVTMSMGETGTVTRLVGGAFGSALTFATAGSGASASGQVEISRVRAALAQAGLAGR